MSLQKYAYIKLPFPGLKVYSNTPCKSLTEQKKSQKKGKTKRKIAFHLIYTEDGMFLWTADQKRECQYKPSITLYQT